ncbi:hypothetical protein GOBAR_DD32359 [Gossypium barbadense]|nr:hypothetical protein GOBAR_DD32359 [Gossypium barbadense]
MQVRWRMCVERRPETCGAWNLAGGIPATCAGWTLRVWLLLRAATGAEKLGFLFLGFRLLWVYKFWAM